MMKCGGSFENVRLQLGYHHFKTHSLAIDMGGGDIFLGLEWLHTLGLVTMEFNEIYLRFNQNSHTHTLSSKQAPLKS